MEKIQKPNWTLLELHEKLNRLDDLFYKSMDHESDCQCNVCIEFRGLDALIDTFSNDEAAASVKEAIKYGRK